MPNGGAEVQQGQIPQYLEEALRGLIVGAQGIVPAPGQPEGGVGAWEQYPAQRVAPEAATTEAARRAALEEGERRLPYELLSEGARRSMEGSTFPESYQAYMDPYRQDVVRRIADEGTRAFEEDILPKLEGAFVGRGAHGSKRHADLARRAARDVQSEIAARQAQALSGGYQHAMRAFNLDRARQLEQAKNLSNIGYLQNLLRTGDIDTLRKLGAAEEARKQFGMDIGYQDWSSMKEHPYQRLSWLSSILHGTPYAPSFYRTTQAPPRPELWQQGLGVAAQLAPQAMSMFSGGGGGGGLGAGGGSAHSLGGMMGRLFKKGGAVNNPKWSNPVATGVSERVNFKVFTEPKLKAAKAKAPAASRLGKPRIPRAGKSFKPKRPGFKI